jgi:L-threonylcarbamoyladenylate synthase
MKPVYADHRAIELAADLLRRGKLVAFPTETVYGLGADALNPTAVARIFSAKGRPADHPLIVHIPDASYLSQWAIDIPDAVKRLTAEFWPGPLAIILKKQPAVPMAVTGGQNTVALRMPSHPVALQLLQIFSGGIAAPSANRFCRISPTQAIHVFEELGNSVDFILDGGPCQVGVESTIIDFSKDKPILLRPGQITQIELEAFLQTEIQNANHSAVRAPGMMEIHYAPMTPTLLCPANQLPKAINDSIALNRSVGVLACHQTINSHASIQVLTMPQQADDYAQSLYAALRELDRLNLDLILVEQPPVTMAWSAINDRLAKATNPY